MNLRTITFWAIYDPKHKYILTTKQRKRELVRTCHVPDGCVVVKMKGHYVRKRSSTRSASK